MDCGPGTPYPLWGLIVDSTTGSGSAAPANAAEVAHGFGADANGNVVYWERLYNENSGTWGNYTFYDSLGGTEIVPTFPVLPLSSSGVLANTVPMWDIRNDGVGIPYIMHVRYSATGQPINVSRTTLDGVTDYTPIGTPSLTPGYGTRTTLLQASIHNGVFDIAAGALAVTVLNNGSATGTFLGIPIELGEYREISAPRPEFALLPQMSGDAQGSTFEVLVHRPA